MSTAALRWHEDEAVDGAKAADWAEKSGELNLKWKLLAFSSEPTVPISKSATGEDVALDSPNWLHSKLVDLAARRFVRRNDPRR